jgi:AcrR family transcriptional regulator
LPGYNLTDGGLDSTLLRNEPVQARSAARLTGLLDAAAAVVDEIGYERLTTAMVAERAGASIGTVYRYFPDRIVVLQGLSARLLGDLLKGLREIFADSRHASLSDLLTAAHESVVESHRSVPGFRSLRFGDSLDLPRPDGSQPGSAQLAVAQAEWMSERFGLSSDELATDLEVVLVMSDALLHRAFYSSREGQQPFLDQARTIVIDTITAKYGNPSTR